MCFVDYLYISNFFIVALNVLQHNEQIINKKLNIYYCWFKHNLFQKKLDCQQTQILEVAFHYCYFMIFVDT